MRDDRIKEQLGRSLYLAREKIEHAAPMLVDVALNMIGSEEVSDKVKSALIGSLLDRAGINAPKTAIQVNINTEISDRAREILAQTVDIPSLPAQWFYIICIIGRKFDWFFRVWSIIWKQILEFREKFFI